MLVAHPGHELLLYGWLAQATPVVHVLTDGSGQTARSRLSATAQILDTVGASRGTLFGAMTDREAYTMILDGDRDRLFTLVSRLAEELHRERPEMLVTDAAEGYNPVHDLCRLIGGAAIHIAESGTKHLEYAVVGHPSSAGGAITIDLDDRQHAKKMDEARHYAPLVPDIHDLLARYGAGAYFRETLRPVDDWMHVDVQTKPDYERFGEERGHARVIRRDEHFLPLRDALCEEVLKRSCAF